MKDESPELVTPSARAARGAARAAAAAAAKAQAEAEAFSATRALEEELDYEPEEEDPLMIAEDEPMATTPPPSVGDEVEIVAEASPAAHDPTG